MLRQTVKIMTESSKITNRLSVTMTGSTIDYLFSYDWPALIACLKKFIPFRICLLTQCNLEINTENLTKFPSVNFTQARSNRQDITAIAEDILLPVS